MCQSKPSSLQAAVPNTAVPNVVLAGVRKCGTTSVFKWLNDHPSVCSSDSKGTEYLMDQDSPFRCAETSYHDRGLEGYGELFPQYAGQPVLLDATTRYFDQATARTVLRHLNPPPDVIFVLREPAARLFSLFRYLKNKQHKLGSHTTFQEFVDCLFQESYDRLLPIDKGQRTVNHIARLKTELAAGLANGRYVDHLHQWRAALGARRMHIYLFEQLRVDAKGFMQQLACDIGIDPDYYEHYSFRACNRTTICHSPLLDTLIRNFKPFVPKTSVTRQIVRFYKAVQQTSAFTLTSNDRHALRQLRDYYASFNRRLANDFALDLSAWQEVETT